jgi:hypothetical protein
MALPEPTGDVEAGLRNLAVAGVSVHRGFLSPREVSAVRSRLEEQAALELEAGVATIGGVGGIYESASPPADGKAPVFQRVELLANKGDEFTDLIAHPTALAYATGVLGEKFNLWSMSGMITRRGVLAQPRHIDQGIVPPDMCTRPALLNIFICLSDFDADMGATRIAPGTHLLPRPEPNDTAAMQSVVAEVGDAIIWEGRTWHGGGAHDSPRTRVAIPLIYCLPCIRQNDVYTSALHDNVYARTGEAILEILGFRAEAMGYSGRIGPRVPDDVRTNTNKQTRYIPALYRT